MHLYLSETTQYTYSSLSLHNETMFAYNTCRTICIMVQLADVVSHTCTALVQMSKLQAQTQLTIDCSFVCVILVLYPLRTACSSLFPYLYEYVSLSAPLLLPSFLSCLLLPFPHQYNHDWLTPRCLLCYPSTKQIARPAAMVSINNWVGTNWISGYLDMCMYSGCFIDAFLHAIW